ncbi:MAG: energy transducer TonB [Pyrinomonadaceae bacterium MAG19_C2-C3]|nr:energy transducer TonB [Pyrinomonadaceae bacterium MAG19_C2-C3]
MKKIIASLTLILCANLICSAQSADAGCDFSKYKPLRVSHRPPDFFVTKVKPEYPPSAKAARVEGVIRVKLLIDLKGNVAEACVPDGHPLLRKAAKEAALQWKFKPNFGFAIKFKTKNGKHKLQFLEQWITFTFRLDES